MLFRSVQCDDFNKACVLLGMLDAIAIKVGEDPGLLRRFFVLYGPMGVATYTKRLVDRVGDPVYQGLNADGKQVVTQIANFQPASGESVDELFRVYTPLLEMVKKLQSYLVDNPYCVSTGIYESTGVLCTNLAGCFAFQIFGRSAPLGFHAWIESAKGETEDDF